MACKLAKELQHENKIHYESRPYMKSVLKQIACKFLQELKHENKIPYGKWTQYDKSFEANGL